MFTAIRKAAIAILVISIGALAFLGILSIWEVLEQQDVYKSLTSMGIISFASFLVILVAMEREGKLWQYATREVGSSFSVGRVIGIVLVVLLFVMFFSRFLFRW